VKHLVHVLVLTVIAGAASLARAQTTTELRIRVTLIDAAQQTTPVPRHALLISDNPATTEPKRVLTSADGVVVVRLTPGTYTVESDRPIAFNGRGYQWTQMIEVAAGRTATLELTAANAEIGPPGDASPMAGGRVASLENDPALLLPRWQDSVVTLWTPTARATGFVIDSKGLVATSRRAIGDATAVEVQLSPSVKVAGRVLVADRGQDVAILWIDPTVTSAIKPVAMACDASGSSVEYEQELLTIYAPLNGARRSSSGRVTRVASQAAWVDFSLGFDGIGGPVFTEDGRAIGLSSLTGSPEDGRQRDWWVVPARAACEAVKTAESKMSGPPPASTRLPVEPTQPPSAAAPKAAAQSSFPPVPSYQQSSDDFDITFITPLLAEAARERSGRFGSGGRRSGPPNPAMDSGRLLTDFANWTDYVNEAPAVLLIRATPRFTESFWKTLARGAAMTQGVALPPLKSFKPGFGRMQLFCGATEVTPIHPFILEQRLSKDEAIHEGLYAFALDALGPQCGTVKLVLYSEKAPNKGDTIVIAPKVLGQLATDLKR
jgi:S1-C subfamily serine protease